MKLLKYRSRNPGDGRIIEEEPHVDDFNLKKFKFSNRQIPQDKKRVLFITCFSEFGCESIALMYCIPKIIEKYPGCYVICVGWHGREYLYRHLVDEFWEINEELQWLREYSLAFTTTSKNITKLEEYLKDFGNLYKGSSMGQICLGNTCLDCKNFWGGTKKDFNCPRCSSKQIDKGVLNDIFKHKKHSVKVPRPSLQCVNYVQKYLKPNSVGIFARGRVCYGRNLSPHYYINLIQMLKSKGYNPIWLGEKQSVLPCPVDDIVDFSSDNESRNLELTLALISQLDFTIQYWTASTRLASMVNTPWILFESPDQITGFGQEGIRISLTTEYDKKKLVLAQFKKVQEEENIGLVYTEKAINEMKDNNWNDIIGPVDHPEIIRSALNNQNLWEEN
jgi:hypothetical protein